MECQLDDGKIQALRTLLLLEGLPLPHQEMKTAWILGKAGLPMLGLPLYWRFTGEFEVRFDQSRTKRECVVVYWRTPKKDTRLAGFDEHRCCYALTLSGDSWECLGETSEHTEVIS